TQRTQSLKKGGKRRNAETTRVFIDDFAKNGETKRRTTPKHERCSETLVAWRSPFTSANYTARLTQTAVPSLRSGFRQKAPAALTPSGTPQIKLSKTETGFRGPLGSILKAKKPYCKPLT